MIDKKGRLFGLVNILDLIIIVVIVAMIAGVAYKLTYLGTGPGAQEKTARVTLLVEAVRQPTVDAIQVGDVVREYDTSSVFGTVVKKDVREAVEVTTTSEGKNVLSTIPGKYDITLTLDVTAYVTPDAITIARKETRIGTQVRIKTALYAVMTTVMGIEISD
ncbi:MAG: DUF4330 domain-containing protein [Bacillota bacterium]